MEEERFLSKKVINKAIISGKEYAWYKKDFKNVLIDALSAKLAIIGGQVQFKLPDGTCELYWHYYNSKPRYENEDWKNYCFRTFKECLEQFDALPSTQDLIEEGINRFSFLKEKSEAGFDLRNHLIFCIYFSDVETDTSKYFLGLEANLNNLSFKIEEDNSDVGWYLYVYENGDNCIADYLQDDLQKTLEFTNEKYNIDLSSWSVRNNT